MTLNLEYALDVDELGATVMANGTLLVSYKDGTDYGVKAVDATTKAVGQYDGLDFKSPIKKAEGITKWTLAEFFMKALPNGTSVEFWYQMNKNGSFVQATVADSSGVQFATANAKKVVFRIQAEGEIFSPRLILNPNGNNTPEVYRQRYYFE